ncbi:MAG: LamG-like jellyroll fold domain-containing protein [Flavobacteriales bacterium]
MKNGYWIKNVLRKKLSLYLLLCGLIIPGLSEVAYGKSFNAGYIKNTSLDKNTKKISFKMDMWDNDGCWGCKDDHLEHMNVYVNGYLVMHVKNSGSINLSVAGNGTAKFNYASRNGVSVYAYSNGDNKHATFQITLPEHLQYLQNYNISFSGSYDEGGGFNVSKPVYGWSDIPAPFITASQDECGHIDLSWSASNSDYRAQFQYQIPERPWSNFISTDSPNSHNFSFENSADSINNKVAFRVKLGYGNSVKRGATSTVAYGYIPEIKDHPNNIQASLNRCDTTVRMTWGWSGSTPEGFIIGYKNLGQWHSIDTVQGNEREFIVDQNHVGHLEPNEFDSIRISTINECIIRGNWGTNVGKWMDDPDMPTNLAVIDTTIDDERVIYVTWDDNAINESRYVLKKTLFGGANSEYIILNENDSFYVDNNTAICNKYIYEIFAQNICTGENEGQGISNGEPVEKVLTFDLEETFLTDENFQGSKGYFPNYVQLEWSPANNSNLIELFKIHRRLLGSNDSYTQIASETSGSHLFLDETASAGSLYEYLVIGEAQCLTETVYTDTLYGVGFRSPTAIVNGQINYTGGIAVEGVKVQFETATNSGKSLQFDGSSYLNAKNNFQNPSNQQEFYLESWMKPTSGSDFKIFDKFLGFTFEYENNTYKFNAGDQQNAEILSGALNLNQWQHIGLKLEDDSLGLFINGVLSDRIHFTNQIALDQLGFMSVGEGLTGYMDEIRVWNTAPSDSLIARDYSRFLNGDEIGLVTYLRCDEIGGDHTYDLSHEGEVYHKNDAVFVGNVIRSSEKPTLSQLSYTSYTNHLGSYSVLIPYSGVGQNFTVTPSYETHQFSPATTALFLGDGATVNNGIDFEDVSSFVVTGSVFYQNSSCPSEKIGLFIDGEPVIANGYPVETKSDGTFEINVPIGHHIVEVKKYGHTFSEGRFPSVGTFDFQEPLSGVEFIDSTFKTIVGRVVGGTREQAKKPGFGKSKNNIGQAQVVFKSQLGNGCFIDTVLTDPLTGEYKLNVPPLKFIPDVSVNSNVNVKLGLGVLDLIEIEDNEPIKTVYDSIYFQGDSILSHVDSFQYHYQIDYIYRNDPEISVKNTDGLTSFSGEKSYSYKSVMTGTDTTINLIDYPMKWPVFLMDDGYNEYKGEIRVFETYQNFDNGQNILDSVPTIDGEIRILSEFSKGGLQTVSLDKINTIDSVNTLVFTMPITGEPNFLENISIPDYSYTKTLEISVNLETGKDVKWLPVTNPNTGAKESFRGYLLGRKSIGNQFVTNGPQDVDFILRDPPGSSSSASREIGTTTTANDSWSYSASNSGAAEVNASSGVKLSTGIGVQVETEITYETSLGVKSEVSLDRSGALTTTVTSTNEWSTDDGSDQTGAGSDLFIGTSKNVEFGLKKELMLIPVEDTADFSHDKNSLKNGFVLGNKTGINIEPKGYETQFIYSQNHIKNYLIPELIQKRNATLQSDPRYVSHLSITDPNYGKNNDNPVFGNQASTTTQFNRETSYLDNSGISYTYTPLTEEDSLKDIVWSDNHQIDLWEKHLRKNEWEKLIVDDQGIIDSLKNAELEELNKEYALVIAAYSLLSAAELKFAANTHISSLSGAAGAIPGSISFVKTAVVGTATAELTNSFNEYLHRRDDIIDLFNRKKSNYSISGGSSFTASMSHERAISNETALNYDMSVDLSHEIKVKVNGNGPETKFQTSFGYTRGRAFSREKSTSEVTTFTLADGDQGDYFSVDVYPSLLGYGPIFKLKAGGRTSCPFEDAVYTEYYKPGTKISEKTLQRDKPSVSISPSIVQNVPMDGAAVFNLTLGNISESNDAREYNIQMVSNSNPFGAIVKVDGIDPENTISINGNSSFNKVLTVEKGPGPVFNYDSLLFIITAPCQYEAGTSDNHDIADSVYFSAHFIPGCSDIALANPSNQWVLNNSFNDTLPVSVVDYDINFSGLNRFRINYKPSNQADWIGLESYYKDTIGLNDPNAKLIPTTSHFTNYAWDVSQLTDGNYDLRVITECDQAGEESPIYSGVIDRVNPHAFGSPSPADGILSAEDEISITFNEDIESGSLSQKNFDIRGVLNGSEIRHQVSTEFDGSSSYVEIPSGLNLQTRDFTVEFWLKNGNYNDAIFFSQGPGSQEGIKIGAESSGKIYFEIDGERVRTDGNVANSNEWHHYAFAYNYSNETVEIFVDGSLRNTSNINIYSDYIGSGKIWIGKGTFGSPDHFEGNIHDLRIWNHTRSLPQVVSHMNVQVGKQNLGLLHNWKMDEATGTTITDHVRLRNGLLKNTEWALNPGGYAMTFDTVNAEGYTLSSANVSFTDEMDFTLEFWYNGTSTSRETLFSNGKGDGIGADSLSSMSLTKYEDGSLHLLHFGQDIVVAETGSFDGNWHHIAIVIDRTSVVSSYLDGNLSSTTLAASFKEFGSSQFVIGSRYFQNGAIKEYDEHFTGSVDEFRIWSLARSQTQINRDMRYKLQGDELGLVSYIPFEHYEKNLGVFILEENYTDQADTSHHESYFANSLSGSSPKIKLPRPVEKVNFTYSVNGDKIILTPTSPKAKIENVSLDVTVKDVLDLYGNSMQSPATWIAFPDQNQIVWETELVTIDILKDEGYSFTKKIVNSGGSAKNFTIENIPSWLTTSVTEGLIEPGSTFEVTFTVVEEVNIGSYKEDIIVMTDFNYPERLTVDLKVRGTTPNWDVNPGNFEKSMSVIGSIGINDVVSIDPEDILYVFINDECRGKTNLQYISSTDRFVAFLDVYSNNSAADTLEFKIWDASTGSIFVDVTPDDITFVTDGLEGSLLNPKQFDAYSKVQENYALQPGWNWVSFHLGTTDTLHLATLLSSLELQDGDQIKTLGNNTFATYSSTFGWLGNLRNTGVNLAKGYKIKLSQADTLVNIGDVVDPASYNVNLQTGWNWIGFVSIRPMNTNVALGNLEPTTGDLIKGRANFSVYDEQLGWIGSLNTMYPNQSYMYNSLNAQATNFTFPVAGGFKMASSTPYSELTDARWPVNYGKSISNMSAVVELEQCENPINLDEWYIGFFDGTGTCRSLSTLEQINDEKQLAFVTAVGNDDLSLTPKLLNKVTGEELVLDGGLTYQANSHKGSYETPVVVSLKAEDCLKFTQPTPEEEVDVEGGISVYPIEFNASFTVEYTSLTNEALTLELVNAQGQVVIQLEQEVQIGANKFEVNKQLSNLPTGVYVLRINQTKQTNLFKLVKHR